MTTTLMAGLLLATTYYVAPSGGSDSNDGLSPTTAFATLAKGVQYVSLDSQDPSKYEGNELVLLAGTHSVAANVTVPCATNVVIRGETSDASETVLDGGSVANSVRFSGGPAVVRNFTVTRFTGGSQAALDADDADVVAVTFDNIAMVSCGATDNNVVAMSLTANCRVLNSVFDHCMRAKVNGPACVNAQAGAVVSNCVFRNYTRVLNGVYLVGSAAGSQILGCTFVNNFIGQGGAIGGVIGTISDCVFRQNILGATDAPSQASKVGNCGLIRCANYDASHHPLVERCTFADNVATNMSGCVINYYRSNGGDVAVNLIVRDCLVSNNLCYALSTDSSTDFAASGAAVYGVAGAGNRFERTRFIGNSCFGHGGAVYLALGSQPVVFESCTFDGNVSSNNNGGAIFAYSPVCTDCTFVRNSSVCGGAVYLYTNGVAIAAFTNCTFRENVACDSSSGDGKYGLGGAVNVATAKNNAAGTTYGFADFVGCTFEANEADYYGGAVICGWNGGVRGIFVDRCLFKGNCALNAQGGGIFFRLSTDCADSTIRNSIFESNDAKTSAGAIYMGSQVNCQTIWNCTFVSNSVAGSVQDQKNGSAVHAPWSFCVRNGLFYDNFTRMNEAKEALYYTNCCFYASDGATLPAQAKNTYGCVLGDPLLSNASGGDYSLTSSSPCRDAGCNAAWMDDATDYRGQTRYPRIVGGVVDIGAYEFRNNGGMLILFCGRN